MSLTCKPKYGFTLLELMVALAIAITVGLLAYPAMNTYLTQSKVSDAIQSVAPVQSSVVNKIASLGTTTGSGTGVTVPTTLSRYISTCTVSANGVITVTTTSSAGAISFTLTPSYDTPTETVSWVCAVSSSASDPSVPNECRI